VLRRFKEVGLKLKPAKCKLLRHELDFLGHTVSGDGYRPSEKHKRAIASFPVPTDIAELRRFLGMASFFRRFVEGFASIAVPLNSLLKDNSSRKYEWLREHQEAFDDLKNRLISPPVLRAPDSERPFVLCTDASTLAVGGVLLQKARDDAPFHAVGYTSATLTATWLLEYRASQHTTTGGQSCNPLPWT